MDELKKGVDIVMKEDVKKSNKVDSSYFDNPSEETKDKMKKLGFDDEWDKKLEEVQKEVEKSIFGEYNESNKEVK